MVKAPQSEGRLARGGKENNSVLGSSYRRSILQSTSHDCPDWGCHFTRRRNRQKPGQQSSQSPQEAFSPTLEGVHCLPDICGPHGAHH
ncbi:MRVI1 isoform 8 [Pongo abelii]|uniref:MRVI1 isoform 8 n=1 Tax=Pongo abelii TaxID=9601 RepID=A0A2J8UPX4_PONAB|nr:MRVI1 isoform 8 [Pongo abelii]